MSNDTPTIELRDDDRSTTGDEPQLDDADPRAGTVDPDHVRQVIDETPDPETVRATFNHEPIPVTVAVRTVDVERIDLERDDDETIAAWVRDAVASRLGCGWPAEGADAPGRPAGYTAGDHDTPDAEVRATASSNDPGEYVGLDVELPAGAITGIVDRAGPGETVAGWIRGAVDFQLITADADHEIQPTVRVDVPAPVAQRAHLKAQRRVINADGVSFENALHDALLSLVQPQTEYYVGGRRLAGFAGDSGGE